MGLDLLETALIGRDDGVARRLHDTVEQLLALFLGGLQFPHQRRSLLAGGGKLRVPDIPDHVVGGMEERGRRLEVAEQGFELAFDPFLAHGFAVVGTALRIAQIVGIATRPAFRPAGRHRLVARGAADEAAQREVVADILAERSLGEAVAAFLDDLEGCKRDQAFMLAFKVMQSPALVMDISGIDGAREQFGHPLRMNLAPLVLLPGGLALEEALDLDLGLEAARCVAVQSFGDDRGIGLVAHQKLAVSGCLLIAVADRCVEHPVAAHGAGAHAVLRLLAILLALVLRDRGEQVLDQDGIGILAELDRRALQTSPGIGDRGTKMQMRLEIARQPGDVVDDDHDGVAAVLLEEVQGSDHARAGGRTAAHVVAEDRHHLVILVGGVFAAARFLRGQAVALAHLLHARDAAVDDRFLGTGLD